MRISAIKSYQTHPNFYGDSSSSNKTNKLKNAAAAAAIAIAAAIPAEEADAQYYYPLPVYPQIPAVPMPSLDFNPIPDCFILGDRRNVDYSKSMQEVFSELDLNNNGAISAREAVTVERNNWNINSIYPFSQNQMIRTEAKFNALSENYNDDDSNPNTINYDEYKEIMNDYMKAKQISNFIKLYTLPGLLYPPPPPPHHHHHRHDAPPPHHRHRH